MKKTIIACLTLCLFVNGMSQDKKSTALLKELAENGCNCVDTINTDNVSKEVVAKAISTCIDAQARAYQLGSKLFQAGLSTEHKKKDVTVMINTDKDSKEYRESYFQLERYMMDNCKNLKKKIGASDVIDNKSVSMNPIAQKYYSKGQKEFKKENYKKAITFYTKALKVDSVFAFAWDNIGICSRKLSDYDGAIRAYKKSLELDPNGLMPLQNIAVAYKFNNEYEKAISSYQKLAELDRNNPEVYYGIGETYTLYLKDYEKGLENICKAYNLYMAEKSPYRSDAEKIISVIYVEMKKQDKVYRFEEILDENDITADFK